MAGGGASAGSLMRSRVLRNGDEVAATTEGGALEDDVDEGAANRRAVSLAHARPRYALRVRGSQPPAALGLFYLIPQVLARLKPLFEPGDSAFCLHPAHGQVMNSSSRAVTNWMSKL